MDRLRRVGLMDESFFMYGEDVDYSLKVIDNNLDLVIQPKAFIWHKVGSSSNGDLSSFSAYWMMFGRIRNIRKHGGVIGKYIALLVVFLSRLIVFPYYLVKNKGYLIGCQVRAIVNGLATR